MRTSVLNIEQIVQLEALIRLLCVHDCSVQSTYLMASLILFFWSTRDQGIKCRGMASYDYMWTIYLSHPGSSK